MKCTLPNFSKANVLVVGDVMLDRYLYGISNRISPEAPVPIVNVDTIEDRPGGAANVAMNIAALGASSRLISITGVDDAAQYLIKKLSSVNVICDFISIENHSTITKLRVLSKNQQLIRIDFEKNLKNIHSSLIFERIKNTLHKYGVLVLSDYSKGTLEDIHPIIELARSISIPILIDPKGSDFSRYRGATLLTPNISEFEAVVGPCKDDKILASNGMKLISDYELSALLITRSENGMTLLQPDKIPLHFNSQAKDIYDVTGAGDTVSGVLAAALSIGNNFEEACVFANAAAGIVVGKLGTSTVSLVELEHAVLGYTDYNYSNILNESDLKQAVIIAQKHGETVVMTNGIFDILHVGHISYLTNARKLGDRLIVAINSDASTKRLKGNTRPINSLKQRMTVIASLKYVDWVISFHEDTPQRLVNYIQPDILMKGGDYKINEISGRKEVLDNGGDVRVLNFEKGFSTTNIINTIIDTQKK